MILPLLVFPDFGHVRKEGYLSGENLKAVWAEFSTFRCLVQFVYKKKLLLFLYSSSLNILEGKMIRVTKILGKKSHKK